MSFEGREQYNPDAELEQALAVYRDSPYLAMKAKQAERGEGFTVGFTDIDNTFHRKDRQQESEVLFAKAEELEYPLVAVTGNDLAGIQKRQAAGELPKFPVLIGSVGTEIHVLQPDGTYRRDEAYRKMLLEEKHFNRPEIAAAASAFLVSQPAQAAEVVYQKPEAERRYLANPEPEAVNQAVQEFKLSFYFFADAPAGVEGVMQEAATAFPGQELVACEEIGYNREHEGEPRKKYCLDVLPITKAGAVDYVAKLTNVEKGLVAGDSGNDTDMLMRSGKLQAVVVGGAKSELVSAVDASAPEKPGKSSFRRVMGEDGALKAIYVEKGDRLGPESISYAAEVLQRAERIQKIRTDRTET
ncbi:MAG: HAD family hydrolase [Patescibacteria group bacterium]|jgi:hydroxymethylpyrimidine pyrophosphatase-like HAD family hydrolase